MGIVLVACLAARVASTSRDDNIHIKTDQFGCERATFQFTLGEAVIKCNVLFLNIAYLAQWPCCMAARVIPDEGRRPQSKPYPENFLRRLRLGRVGPKQE